MRNTEYMESCWLVTTWICSALSLSLCYYNPHTLHPITQVLERSGVKCITLDGVWTPWSQSVVKEWSGQGSIPVRYGSPRISYCNTLLFVSESSAEALTKLKPKQRPVRFITVVVVHHLPDDPHLLHSFLNSDVWRGRRTVILSLQDGSCSSLYVKTELQTSFTLTPLQNFTPIAVESMRGEQLTVATFNCTIYSHLTISTSEKGRGENTEGIEIRLMEVMAKHLGLSLSYIPALGHGILELNNTYTWGSVKYLVTRGEADAGFCELWVTPDLYLNVDMLRPWHRSGIRYLVPRPRHKRYLYAGLESIPTVFWVYLIASISGSVPILRFVTTRRHITSPLASGCDKSWYWEIQVVSLVVTGMPAGGRFVTRAVTAVRLIVTAWSFFSLLVVTVYSCKLVSRLNKPSWQNPIETEQQMISADFIWSRFNIAMNSLKYIYPEQTPWLKEWIRRHRFDTDMREREARMRSGKYAIYGQAMANIYYLPEDSKPAQHILSTYQASSTDVITYPITIMMSKWSSFTPPIRKLFSRLSDSGIIDKISSDVLLSPFMQRYIVREAFIRCERCDSKTRGLNMDVMVGPFIILAVGYLISTIVFGLEILHHTYLHIPTIPYYSH